MAGPEAVGIIKTLLIFSVTEFNLAVVPRSIRTNELMADAEFGSGAFKQRWNIAFRIRKNDW